MARLNCLAIAGIVTVYFTKQFVDAGVTRFGTNLEEAAFLCRCEHDACDPISGVCLRGERCVDGMPRNSGFEWRGPSCQIGNVAYGKPARQHGLYKEFTADLAVDGNLSTLAHPSRESQYHPVAWWTVDLEDTYLIYNLTFFGSTRWHYRNDFRVTIGDEPYTHPTSNPVCLTKMNSSLLVNGRITFSCETAEYMTGRYVSFERNSGGRDIHHANLNEVIVLGIKYFDCKSIILCHGDYDRFMGCEMCANGTRLPDCHRECAQDRYGQNCKETCPINCKTANDRGCNAVNGVCDQGCNSDGGTGPFCDIHPANIEESGNSTLYTVIGVLSAFLVMITIAFVIVFIRLRRSLSSQQLPPAYEHLRPKNVVAYVNAAAPEDKKTEEAYSNPSGCSPGIIEFTA